MRQQIIIKLRISFWRKQGLQKRFVCAFLVVDAEPTICEVQKCPLHPDDVVPAGYSILRGAAAESWREVSCKGHTRREQAKALFELCACCVNTCQGLVSRPEGPSGETALPDDPQGTLHGLMNSSFAELCLKDALMVLQDQPWQSDAVAVVQSPFPLRRHNLHMPCSWAPARALPSEF